MTAGFIILGFGAVACGAMLGWSLRGLATLGQCSRERKALLDAAFKGSDYEQILPFYEAVSFERHHRFIILGRDAFALYDTRLLARLAPGVRS